MSSLQSKSEFLVLASKNYAKTGVKVYWSCPTLLDILDFPKLISNRYLNTETLAYNSPQSPLKFNMLVFFITSKSSLSPCSKIKAIGLQNSFKFRSFVKALFGILGLGQKLLLTRDNVLLNPQQRPLNNFEKVQFWAKFDLFTPMGPGQEFSQRQQIHSWKCLISV